MSYIERGVYWYLKNIFLGGLKILFSRRYAFFTVFSISIVLLSFFNPSMKGLETIAAISLLAGAIYPLLFPLAFVLMIFTPWVSGASFIFAPLWAFLTALIALMIPRDLVDSWAGYALFFGNPKGHVPFNPIFNMIFIAGAAISVVIKNQFSLVFLAISLLMIFVTNYVARFGRNDRFGFTMSIFYLNILYYFIALGFPGLIVTDSFFILITLFFAVQANTKVLQSKINTDSAVLVTLALALGFHSAGFSNYHLYQISSAFIIFPLILFFFMTSQKFKHYFTRQPSVRQSILDFTKRKFDEFISRFGI